MFLLSEPPPEPSVALHTSHRMLGRIRVTYFSDSSFPGAELQHDPLLSQRRDFDNTTTAALYVVLLYTLVLSAVTQIRLHNVAGIKALLVY